MSRQVWKPAALLAPVPPTLVTCGTMEHPNVLTVAWTGILQSHPPKLYIALRPERHSYAIIEQTREFAVNLPTEQLVRAVDFCGVKSGRNTDKFRAVRLTPLAASEIACPILAQSPLSLECRVTDIVPMGGTHTVFVADIVAVNVDDRYVSASGRLQLAKAGLLAYAHGEYFALGRRLGSFGCSVRRRKPRAGGQNTPPKP